MKRVLCAILVLSLTASASANDPIDRAFDAQRSMPRTRGSTDADLERRRDDNRRQVLQHAAEVERRRAEALRSTQAEAGAGAGPTPVSAAAHRGAATFVCEYRCSDASVLNEHKTGFLEFPVKARDAAEARELTLPLARRSCSERRLVLRTEWAGVGGCRSS